MNKDIVITIIDSILKEMETRNGNIEQSKVKQQTYISELLEYHDASASLIQYLDADDNIGQSGGHMVRHMYGSSGFHSREIAVNMVKKAKELCSSGLAVEWLEKVLNTKYAYGNCIMALSGIKVKSKVSLTDTICLVPMDDVPYSKEKDMLVGYGDSSQFHRLSPLGGVHFPTSALIYHTKMDPFIYKAKYNLETILHKEGDATNSLEEARLALTIVGPCGPVHAGSWFQYDDPDLQDALFFGGLVRTHIEIVPWSFSEKVEIDPTFARKAVLNYFSLKEPTKNRVRNALHRLNQAVRRFGAGDKAVEISIALETLLTNGPGENTHKVGLRSALLLEGDDKERIRNRAIVAAIYTIRSALLHSGVVPAKVKVRKFGDEEVTKVVDECINITGKIIFNIMKLGHIPDWYLYELKIKDT